ncbi:MAG: hypothetical protein VX255_15130 [Candidatus Latescibacterota bacterium]|nr:hypothetical protein [Candidatus Latescibacterota bacterium]
MPARKKGAAKNAPARSKASKSQAAAKLPSRKTADKSKAPKTRTAEPAKKRDFKIHAGVQQVSVAGSFNERDPFAKALRQGKDAVWMTWASLPAGTHEYRFIIDGEWLEDPSADTKQPNAFGSYNSVVSV